MGIGKNKFMKSMLMRILAAALTLFLGACLGGKEEFWFERNGSGRLEAQYEIPGFAIASLGGEEKLRTLIGDFFAQEPGVYLDEFTVEAKGSQAVLQLRARFDSVLSLSKLMDKSKQGDDAKSLPKPMLKLFGDVNVKRAGMSVDFQRRIDPSQVFAGGLFSPSQEQMKGFQLEYIMHLPTQAIQSNAHEVQDDGHTLIWRYALADAMKQPAETNFVTPIPIPWWVWPALILPPVWLVWWLARRRKRRLQLSLHNASSTGAGT